MIPSVEIKDTCTYGRFLNRILPPFMSDHSKPLTRRAITGTMQETTYHNKPKCLCKQCRPRSDATECNNPKYWDRYVFANSVNPDQTLQNVITLSTGTDIPNSVDPDQTLQNVITLSIGTDMSFQTVYTQIRCSRM